MHSVHQQHTSTIPSLCTDHIHSPTTHTYIHPPTHAYTHPHMHTPTMPTNATLTPPYQIQTLPSQGYSNLGQVKSSPGMIRESGKRKE